MCWQVDVPELGRVTCDVAYGGMWYCIVDAVQTCPVKEGRVVDIPIRGRVSYRVWHCIVDAMRHVTYRVTWLSLPIISRGV